MVKWPVGKRVAITSWFDLNLELRWGEALRNDSEHLVTFEKVNIVRNGMPRILETLDQHQVKASFCIPGYNAEKYPEMVSDVFNRGRGIAFLGYIHIGLFGTSYEQENREMEKAEKVFERLVGGKLVGHRPPWGDFKAHSVQLILGREYIHMGFQADQDGPTVCEVSGKKGPMVEFYSDVSYDDTAYNFYVDSSTKGYSNKTCQ